MLQQRQGGFQDQASHRSPGSRAIKWREVITKAEDLFTKGEYEQALVWYHRGRRLKPKAREFITGITKCEKAIENRCPVALHTLAPRSGHTGRIQDALKSAKSSRVTSQEHQSNKEDLDRDIHHVVNLNKDKKYLQGLLKELQPDSKDWDGREPKSESVAPRWRSVKTLVESSLHYLDTRSTFWKQQMPLHALERLHSRPPTHGDMSSFVPPNVGEENAAFMGLLKEMMKCNQEFIDQQYRRCVPRCENCVKMLKKLRSGDVDNKYEMLSNLYSVLGNAYFELGDYEEALKAYTKDLDIARGKDLKEARSRALENMGRVHARVGEFDTAIRVWKEKAELCEADRECAWLYHEIGYCYLSKKDYFLAQQYAQMSGRAAVAADDIRWRLNATILAAQVQAKMKNYDEALESFRVALIFATDIGDENELTAISHAIDSLEKAIQSRKENHAQKSDVFLTEYFEEEKEQISMTPVPSNKLRHGGNERLHEENTETRKTSSSEEQENDTEYLKRKDTLTPLQFLSKGMDTSHYSKGVNEMAMKHPLPEEETPMQENNDKGYRTGKNRKLYNTPQVQHSTQPTSLDLRQHIPPDPNVIESHGKGIAPISSGSHPSRQQNNALSNGSTIVHKNNNRFSNKFSELRVRHRHEKMPEEYQSEQVGPIPLTTDSVHKMESAYRGHSSKAYVWKPKDKMNVSQFPWKSDRQNERNNDADSNSKEDADADHIPSAKRVRNKKTVVQGAAEKVLMKDNSSNKADDQSGSKRMLQKRVSKTPRSSQSDGTLLTKRSQIKHGPQRSQTVRATDTGFGKEKSADGSYQTVSLQKINASQHQNNSSSGLMSYNVNKSTGVDPNQPSDRKNLNKHRSGSQSLPMLHHKSKDTQYSIPTISQTSRMDKDRNSAISDRNRDLKLPGLTGREPHLSKSSGKAVINMETYQKPLPKEEGIHIPKNILPVKKQKGSNEKQTKSDMDLLKMLLDM